MADLKDRLLRAAKLDVTVYEELEADKEAMGQAMVGVCLIGWVVQSIILAVFLALVGPPRAGVVL